MTAAGCEVTTDGIPVTTPSEFVIDRYDVNGLSYGTVVVEETNGVSMGTEAPPVGACGWPSEICDTGFTDMVDWENADTAMAIRRKD